MQEHTASPYPSDINSASGFCYIFANPSVIYLKYTKPEKAKIEQQ
jgi:hypothetical protein